LALLDVSVTAAGKLGAKTVPARAHGTGAAFFYWVGGVTGRAAPTKDVHLLWRSMERLRVGDVVEVKIVETRRVDRARSRKKVADRGVGKGE
jgi:hypothetical protein